MKYLNDTGLSHFTEKIRDELGILQEQIDQLQSNSGGSSANSWKTLQELVRSGQASQSVAVGDQFVCNHSVFGDILWDVIGINQDTPSDDSLVGSITLQAHHLLSPMLFNQKQALYVCQEDFPSQDCWIQLGTNTDLGTASGQAISFTLLNETPAGSCFLFDITDQSSTIAGVIKVYSDQNCTTLLYSSPATFGSEGEQLTPVNDALFLAAGSGAWETSALRKYLNSDAESGGGWYSSHLYDLNPNYDCPGFLAGLDPEFREVLGSVKKNVHNFETDSTDTLDELIFLPTAAEVNTGYSAGRDETVSYQYYTNLGSTTSAPLAGRVKTLDGTAKAWCLRSGDYGKNVVGTIDESGAYASCSTKNEIAFAPVCCIV